MRKPSETIPDKLEEERSEFYPNIPQETYFALENFLFFIQL